MRFRGAGFRANRLRGVLSIFFGIVRAQTPAQRAQTAAQKGRGAQDWSRRTWPN